MSRISFLGIGLMGAPMVARLLDAGFSLTLWNRTRSKAEPFAGRARIADSPAAAVAEAQVVITMLENGAVVDQVLHHSGALAQLQPGALVIDMSSIEPGMARRHGARVEEAGGVYLDAPVSGGTRGAQAGTLSIMAGGEEADFERATALFQALGKATHIGPVGSGQLAKLANQAIVGITIGAVSEALLLAARGGARPDRVRQALLGGFAGSKILEQHGERMLQRDFQPGAPSRIQLKDLRMILDEARAEGLSLPLSQRVFEQYRALLASGHGEVDHSGLLLELERLNGVRLDGELP
ncbi:2-hydroxy-3-oxopropionate reductase [Alcanivorax hongdengensis A-11-3]|uniref:2-hydroxy-3-oxopropionate reductase n=1 Tax=Alcanivorax hongdengensis A-11-3 TaxID=1177179 RepID=L0WAG7_9GAMM|nr:NAD(P)-dependent oxidoreductase [Alcanivorax hongdengensis]EKF73082.1 2-hydroxy-3-oxopropionate reductase [Alcanivorax hongdengensis A-11-3]